MKIRGKMVAATRGSRGSWGGKFGLMRKLKLVVNCSEDFIRGGEASLTFAQGEVLGSRRLLFRRGRERVEEAGGARAVGSRLPGTLSGPE